MLRFVLAVPVAGVIAGMMFYWMSQLIDREIPPQPPKDPPDVTVTFDPPPPSGPTPPAPRPDQPEAPPPPDVVNKTTRELPAGPTTTPTPTPVDPGGLEPPTAPSQSGPIIWFAPQYPERCRARGTQGSVVVAFEVEPSGSVVNARIVSSDDSCFDREALRTVGNWKYAPSFAGGRREVQVRLSFQLTDE